MNNVALTPMNLLKSDNARPDPEVFFLSEFKDNILFRSLSFINRLLIIYIPLQRLPYIIHLG
ncbi:MAG: hypothetical protein DDT41_01193 [candidate division WS2 bacterium]|nr:hypothetical protein [Candidatus Psychracetigena formicireducens]